MGVIIILVGGEMYIANKPLAGEIRANDFMGLIQASDENMIREVKRGNAVKILAGGAVVAFIGFAMMSSAKKEQ